MKNVTDLMLIRDVLAGQRRAVSKAITLLESTRADHRERADALLSALLPRTGSAIRLGVSGAPGVGKSTFIESLGLHLIAKGRRLAVLAIDPSSALSGGSILGDKTRMERLSVEDRAYIRPSPSAGALGGVAAKTREALLLCEAAGYDVVIVESVGIGQSEAAVASMTDVFVLLQPPTGGDELQAFKKGVLELADLIIINKADLDPAAAKQAARQLASAHRAPVSQISALQGEGIEAFWVQVEKTCHYRRANGEFTLRRQQQGLDWMCDLQANNRRLFWELAL